ncbi:MAG: endonuclease [Acholeplasmatales bacterium]|nr:endonuclease [Acholeplasmatales bacterium]
MKKKKTIFAVAMLALAGVSLASCDGVKLVPTPTPTTTTTETPTSTTTAPATTTPVVTTTTTTEPPVITTTPGTTSTSTTEPIVTTTEPVVSTTTEPVTTTTEPPVTTTTSTSTTTTSSTNTGEYIPPVTDKDVVKMGIYDGNYYDSITSTLLNDKVALKNALFTITNPSNYHRSSYSTAQSDLKTIDSYDGYYVECIYTGERLQKNDAWDREHIWAKSYGFKDEYYDAYSDTHHLRVSEHSINVNRSSSFFDEVANPTNTDKYGNKWTTTVFEPRDEVKGDIARMLLYMTVKYDDPDVLDLELTDDEDEITRSASVFGGLKPTTGSESQMTEYNKRTYVGGTDNPEVYLGKLSTLIKWHYQDPVDAREVYRNNTIFTSYQHNRNPFIDHPEYVYYLYTEESSKYIQASQTADLDCYVNYNQEQLDVMNTKINSIGTVTLQSKDLLESVNAYYAELGPVTKSFVSNYHKLLEANETYKQLEEANNQDTTVSTTFSFLGLSNKNGSASSNGVSIEFTSPAFHYDHGIYSQINKNGVLSPAEISVDGLYSTVKSINFKWNNNNIAGDFATVEVTNSAGEKVEVKSLHFNKSTSTASTGYNANVVNVNISSLTSYEGLKIKVINNAMKDNAPLSSSLRIYSIEFALS